VGTLTGTYEASREITFSAVFKMAMIFLISRASLYIVKRKYPFARFYNCNCYKFSYKQIPKDPLKFSNWTKSETFVKISARCCSVAIYSWFITLSSTCSLMKWWWMSIWLVLICWMRFLKILLALKLFQYDVMTS